MQTKAVFIDKRYSNYSNIIKYYYSLKWLFSNVLYFKMYFISVNFQQLILLQSSVSHDPSEIVLIY